MKPIEVDGLRKEYGPLVAVRDVQFSVSQGDVVGLIGPNGAGKTTLLKMLSTLLRPSRGQAKIMGNTLLTDARTIRKHIGYLPDFFNLYPDLKVRECLTFFAKAYKVPSCDIDDRVDLILKKIHLEDKKDQFIRHLSRGMVQRIGLGAVLVHDPEILFLDEPASGLDPEARIQLRTILRSLSAEGKTILISSHILTEMDGFCSHIAIMNRGSMVLYGSVKEIQQQLTQTRQIQVSLIDRGKEAAELLKTQTGIKIVSAENQMVSFETIADREHLAQLNAMLVEKGFKIFGFTEKSSNLEDLFMQISAQKNLTA
jgi:ABC-2 type transport system ATP-binding protein